MRNLLLLVSLGLIVLSVHAQFSDQPDATEEEIEELQNDWDCYLYGDYYFYDMRKLRRGLDYQSISSSQTYNYNFCQYLYQPCSITDNSQNDTNVYATAVSNTDSTTCSFLGADDSTISTVGEGNETMLILSHQSGQYCNAYNTADTWDVRESSITFNITCALISQLDVSTVTVDETDLCNPVLSFSHCGGCADASLDAISIFFEEYPWTIGIFLIIVGLPICFFGKRFIPWVIGIIGGVVTFCIALLLCSAMGMLDYIDPTSQGDTSVAWVVIGFFLSLAAAILVGWILKKFLVVGLLILAFFSGFFLGGLLYNLVFVGWSDSTALLAIITFGSGIALTVFAFFFRMAIIISTTAFMGAYFFIRGLSLFIGGYPNEMTLYQEIVNGTAEYSTAFIGYLAGIVILTIIGIWYQNKNKDKGTEHEGHFQRA